MQPSAQAKEIGYFPKRVARRPECLNNEDVKEICSVSECISPGPDNWIDKWRHNCMSCFDTSDAVEEIIAPAKAVNFDLFAYRILPLEFNDGATRPFNVPSLAIQPLSKPPVFLGFDVVSRSSDFFECSPLSCNYAAVDHAVNEYCLFESEVDACRLAAAASERSNGFEPGPYFVVEVWRRVD